MTFRNVACLLVRLRRGASASSHHLNRFGQQERRPGSQVIEIALEEFLRKRGVAENEIVTSEGRFEGHFSREETYAR